MLTFEELAEKVEEISKTAQDTHKQVTTMMQIKPKDHPLHQATNENDKNHEAKRANETDEDYEARVAQENEDDKKDAQEKDEKEARKARYNAVKQAMEEDDEEKRDAAIKSAMEQSDPTHNTTPNNKEAQTEDEKEEHAAVASIIGDKRAEYITKILSANKLFNASNIDSVEKRVKKASLTALKKEYKTILPFIGGAKSVETATPTQPVIPYFASMMTPQDVDKSQLTASSPDAAFANLSTKELLKEIEA